MNSMTNDDNSDFLTEKQIHFVAAWSGNGTEAARRAGYSNPQVAGAKLMRLPAVENALRKKQRAMLQESAERMAKDLTFTRADVLNRLWDLAQLDPRSTNNSISVQVGALTTLAKILDPRIDPSELKGKTPEEVEFLLIHGYLPPPEAANQASEASKD